MINKKRKKILKVLRVTMHRNMMQKPYSQISRFGGPPGWPCSGHSGAKLTSYTSYNKPKQVKIKQKILKSVLTYF